MIQLMDKLSAEINDNNFVSCLYIELLKAVDTVNHKQT